MLTSQLNESYSWFLADASLNEPPKGQEFSLNFFKVVTFNLTTF